MKPVFFMALFAVTVSLVCAGGKKDAAASPVAAGKEDDPSFAIGMMLGEQLAEFGMKFDYAALAAGIKAQIEGEKTPYTLADAKTKAEEALRAAMDKKAAEDSAKDAAFLAENKKKSSVLTTESGLQYEVIKEGGGAKPKPDSVVKVHYEGTFLDGEIFDSNKDAPEAAEIPLDQVIPGFAEGLQLMTVGSEYKLYIPAEAGYGDRMLIFDVTLEGFAEAAPDSE